MTENERTDKKKEKPSSPAASHMLWFFLLPAFGFLGWATYQLSSGLGSKKPQSSLVEKARAIQKGRSDGDRWKAAYALSEELLKKAKDNSYKTLPAEEKKEILAALSELMTQFKDDVRLKKYLILTLGSLKDTAALPLLKSNLKEKDGDLRFYSSWGYLETLMANTATVTQEDRAEVRSWLKSEDNALKKIATSFLVQNDVESPNEVLPLLKDADKEVRWNTAVALASVGREEGLVTLKEIFNLQNLRNFGFRSAKDMEQLLKAARVGALRVNRAEINAQIDSLKKSADEKTPEGRAILSALKD